MTVYGRRSATDRNGRTNERERIIEARVTEIANTRFRSAVYALGQDDRGRLWAGTHEGVFYFDRGRFEAATGLAGGDIFAIAGDRQGKVWISSNDCLFYWKPEGAVQRFHWARFGQKHAAVALLADRLQSGLWLGFFEGGIAYLNFVLAQGNTVILDEPDNFISLREIQPWLLAADDAVQASGGQIVIISHHPEIINQWAASGGVRFVRDGIGPVRVEDFQFDPNYGLAPAELVARGWENG